MVANRVDFDCGPTVFDGKGEVLLQNQKLELSASNVIRQFHPDAQWTDRNQLMHRLAPGARVGQVHDMQDQAASLTVQMAVEKTGAFDGERDVVARSPPNQICQQVAMVGQIVASEATVQVCRQIGNTSAFSVGRENQSRYIRVRLAHPRGFRRIDWERRNEREGNDSPRIHLQRSKHPTEGQNVRFVETAKNGMTLRGNGWFTSGFWAIDARSQFGRQS